jgi:hypothetical protein
MDLRKFYEKNFRTMAKNKPRRVIGAVSLEVVVKKQ